jgi:mono/diheme cytochrome c family protein
MNSVNILIILGREKLKKWLIAGASLAGVVAIGAAAFVYSGIYNMGADEHHWSSTMIVIETLRNRSIGRYSNDVKVPDLNNQDIILKGAGQYAAMCVNCHLAPGMSSSEIRPGLYPQPPELAKIKIDPRVVFWVTKHGVKMSGMPAWGYGHDDATLWSIVAFVNKLPTMSPEQYKDIVSRAPPDEEMEGMEKEKKPSSSGVHGESKPPSSTPMSTMPRMR